MKLAFEHLTPPPGHSFRCLNRAELESPVKWHSHPEVELTYVERGRGTRLVGDHIDTFHNGDLVLLGSGLPHTWLSDAYAGQKYDRHPAVVVQFTVDFLGPRFFDVPELHRVKHLVQIASRGIWYPPHVAERIGDLMSGMLQQSNCEQLLSLLTCLHELSVCEDGAFLASEGYAPVHREGVEKRIQDICDVIQERLTDPDLDHRSLAAAAHMHPAAFSRFFKRAAGCSVSHYIHQLRIGMACRLLLESDDSILDIAGQVGFNNLSNFNRRFRLLRGMTPREYRRAGAALE